MKKIEKNSQNARGNGCAHTRTHNELEILSAQPTVEPDRAKIKWPNIKKWKLPQGKTIAKRKTKPRPNAKGIRNLLAFEGRSLNRCETCGYESSQFLQIHHIDGNPFNNDPQNLIVLCGYCHGRRHYVREEMVDIKEECWGTIPDTG